MVALPDVTKEGDLIFKIYSESQSKIKRAENIYNSTGGPIILGGMMIERIWFSTNC